MLVRQQYLMNVVRVGRTAGDVVARHLEHVTQARRIVDIDVGAEALAAALERAARDGYAAVAKPVEGTILSVARAAADAAAAALDDQASLPDVALAAARGAREALERTPDQLDVLKRAGVVDAGGRGLTVVLDAFDTVLTGRRPLPRPRELAAHDVPEVIFAEPEAAHTGPGYEVMYLLDADEQAIPALRAALAPYLQETTATAGRQP